MITETQTILWFDQVGKDDVALVGGKGANLGELTKARIPVPPGFVVSTDAYRRFLTETGLEPTLRDLLHGLDPSDEAALNSVAQQVRDAIVAAPMPDAVASSIREAYRVLGEGPVAVRSSATAEDLAEASFAGQQATYLNVEGAEAVVDAVQRCWASLFEARAIFYRAETGWDDLAVSLAVPVQRMVQSACSGVMFTVDPVAQDRDRIVIEAAYGLGEAVVSGQVSPDHYVVEKSSCALLEEQVVEQERQLSRDPSANGGDPNSWQTVPVDMRAHAKLNAGQIQELAGIGLLVEQHYGAPQDIEWAWADGRFYLLQARPVTTLNDASPLVDVPPPDIAATPLLEGAPAGPGVAVGPVRVILDPADAHALATGDVLVADMTTPDYVPAMKRAAAIVTERGGRTCHAAIISRELGVPCVVGANGAIHALTPGGGVTVDGSSGRVYAGAQQPLVDWWADRRAAAGPAPAVPTNTRIYVNLAEPELADRVAVQAADGVGLLRAEFVVAQIGEHPRSFLLSGRQEQFIAVLEAGVRRIVAAFDPRPVVYRSSDFKTNEYANLKGGREFEPIEENPMIGYRGAARYLHEPELFGLEMEAIKRVRADHANLHLMIPFVRTPDELSGVIQLAAQNGLSRGPDFQIWMMVEVPSNVLLLDEFIDVGLDGLSIGSNDLTQLTLGIDRDSERFADQFDERDPAVLLALESVIRTARRRGLTISICGQGPSEHQDLVERLVDWGITSISVTPDVIDRTRRLVAQAEARAGS